MPKSELTEDEKRDSLRAFVEGEGKIMAAARILGMSRQGVQGRIRSLKAQRYLDEDGSLTPKGEALVKGDEIEFPVFPDDDLPVEQLIDHMERRANQQIQRQEALKWFSIKVATDKPIAIAWMGDPHLGTHCNWSLLRKDMEVIKATPGMYAANGGDTANNWGGYLTKLYADEDISRQTERKLAEWFLEGLPWLVWLIGNHDEMNEAFSVYLKTINANKIPMIDWRAQFKLVFANGRECSVDYAHDHKGSSIWNPLHGQVRVAKSSESADIIVGNHRHNWGFFQFEIEDGSVPTLLRARGYKWIDEYAHRHQFHQQQCGATVVTIIDPQADSPENFVTPMANVQRAADYLTHLRGGA